MKKLIHMMINSRHNLIFLMETRNQKINDEEDQNFNLFSRFFYSFQMNQQCKVCGEPAAGFHFGAFTCEGCKVRKNKK
jgi:hypothetical protein